MATTTTQRTAQQLAAIEANQQATHGTLHQIIAQFNAVTFNASDAGCGTHGYGAGQGYGAGRGCGRAPGRGGRCGFDCGPPQYLGGSFPTPRGRSFPHAPQGGGFPKGYPGGYQGGPARPPAFVPTTFVPPGGAQGGQPGPPPYRNPAGFHGLPQTQQQPFSNLVKRFANWNVCNSCGFDVADGHTSMSCPAHLCKATHDIYFTRLNAQQYINLGHPCSTRNRHKTQFPRTGWLGAANVDTFNDSNRFHVETHSSYPIKLCSSTLLKDDNNATVITSNVSSNIREPQSYIWRASNHIGKNDIACAAFHLNTTDTIAGSGATPFFCDGQHNCSQQT
jgi:hypothetical protein